MGELIGNNGKYYPNKLIPVSPHMGEYWVGDPLYMLMERWACQLGFIWLQRGYIDKLEGAKIVLKAGQKEAKRIIRHHKEFERATKSHGLENYKVNNNKASREFIGSRIEAYYNMFEMIERRRGKELDEKEFEFLWLQAGEIEKLVEGWRKALEE